MGWIGAGATPESPACTGQGRTGGWDGCVGSVSCDCQPQLAIHRPTGLCPSHRAPVRALDICTGLGYTAIALARSAPTTEVTTIELDPTMQVQPAGATPSGAPLIHQPLRAPLLLKLRVPLMLAYPTPPVSPSLKGPDVPGGDHL